MVIHCLYYHFSPAVVCLAPTNYTYSKCITRAEDKLAGEALDDVVIESIQGSKVRMQVPPRRIRSMFANLRRAHPDCQWMQ